MYTLLVVLHLFLALGLVGLILIQHGKGADAGAAFGSGASGTVFGARGAANFLSRATAGLATAFFLTSLTLAWFAMQTTDRPGLMMDSAEPPRPEIEVPVLPEPRGSVPSIEVPVVPESTRAPSVEVPTVPSPVATGESPKAEE